MPVLVSPSFMLETSMATTGVLAGFGFSFTSFVSVKNFLEYSGVDIVKGGCRCRIFFRDRTLSSMNFWGTCKFSFGSGKLYFGVVVIGNCAFTKIHQYQYVWLVLVFKYCACTYCAIQ